MRVVTEFKYLGRVLTNTDDDWPAAAGNIRKARASWVRLERILGREGADLKVTRSFYTAVTQQVLLFGAESWFLTKKMESALDAFPGRVARRLTGRMPRRGRDGKWVYPPLAVVLKEAGVVRARTSVLRRQNTVAQFIATRPFLGLCEVAERRQGTMVTQQWWEQSGIDWKLAREKGGKGGGNSRTRGSTCGGDRDTRIGNESGFRTSPHEGVEHRQHRGGGVTGGQCLQRGRMERGG